jgi:hypothetical protein
MDFPQTVETTMPHTPGKTCLQCAKVIRGRTGKKFCDDYCRNSFNNRMKATRSHLMRNINNALCRNRHILRELISSQPSAQKVERAELLRMGFRFKYFTQLITKPRGRMEKYCYEYGYRPIDTRTVKLVQRTDAEATAAHRLKQINGCLP